MSLEIAVLKFNVLKLVFFDLKFSACAYSKIVLSSCCNGGQREHSYYFVVWKYVIWC
jgi:hypothetical protein